MKKTNLTRSLLAACSIVALSAVMYGCSSSGEDEERGRAAIAEDMLAALAAAAGLPDGTALTAEHIQQAAMALADSQAEVTRLTGALGDANDEVVRLLTELATANANIADLTQDLGVANAEVTRLEGELSDANEEVTRLTGALSEAEANVTRLTADLSTANAENMRLAGELTMANGEIASLTDNLATANAEITSLTGDLAMANSDLADALQDLAAARAQNMMDAETIMALEGRVSALQVTVSDLEGQIEMQNMEIADKDTQISDLGDQLAMANAALADAEQDLMAARMQIAEDAGTIMGLEGRVSELSGMVNHLQGQIETKDNQISGLNTEIGDLKTQISGLNTQISGKDTEIADLKTEIANKNTEIAGLNTQISNKDTEISNKDTEISNKNAEISSLETQIANKNTEINGLNDDIDGLNDDIDELKSDIVAQQGVIDGLRDQLAAAGGEEDDFRARQIGLVISPINPDGNNDGTADDPVGGAHDTAPAFLEDREDVTGTTPDETRSANDQIMAHVQVAANGDHMIDEDEDEDTESGYKPVGSPPSLGGDWRGRILEEELTGGVTNHIVVWSNVEASTAESFKTAYGSLPDGRQSISDWRDDNPGLTDTAAAAAYLEYVANFDKMVLTTSFSDQRGPGVADYNTAPLVAADASPAAFWGLASASGFPAKAAEGKSATTETYFGPFEAGTDGTGDPANADLEDSNGDGSITDADDGWNPNGQMINGTFDGVSGVFECTTPLGCQVRHTNRGILSSLALGADGDVTATAGGWTFTASSSASTVATRRGDDDYMTFGFWLLKPDVAEGDHEFATFFAGREPLTANVADTVTGNAKYEGPAAGKYATRTRGSTDGTFGVFRADAALEADFDDADMVSGTISNFIGEDGSSLGDWNVVLKGAGAAAEVAITDGAFTGAQVGGAADGRNWETGAFAGRFYDDDHVYTDDNNDTFAYPGSVAGEFHARWGDPIERLGETEGFVGVAGGFGASFTEQDND